MRKLKSRLARRLRVICHQAQHRHGREVLGGTIGVLLGIAGIVCAIKGLPISLIGPIAATSLLIILTSYFLSRR